ncbi:MAG: 23S rRNA (adenine(2503)-C(2))-methyltransferase RlmN, partial [Spirochaetota bacterium]
FCSTGKMGFHGQLSTAEILNQIVSIPESASLTNLVFMGMGEPMDNLDEVLGALKVITSPWGFAMSPRRVTVSTVGVLPGLRRFLVESECHLAVSLHFPFSAERQPFMPVEGAYALPEIIATLRSHDFGGQRRLSFEYILFEGLNDAPRHIAELTRLLRGLDCRVNLIAFHAIPDVPFVPASRERLEWFRDELERRNFTATIRASRGLDIQAACGLLSTREMEGR